MIVWDQDRLVIHVKILIKKIEASYKRRLPRLSVSFIVLVSSLAALAKCRGRNSG